MFLFHAGCLHLRDSVERIRSILELRYSNSCESWILFVAGTGKGKNQTKGRVPVACVLGPRPAAGLHLFASNFQRRKPRCVPTYSIVLCSERKGAHLLRGSLASVFPFFYDTWCCSRWENYYYCRLLYAYNKVPRGEEIRVATSGKDSVTPGGTRKSRKSHTVLVACMLAWSEAAQPFVARGRVCVCVIR